jgi:hypothetical protein
MLLNILYAQAYFSIEPIFLKIGKLWDDTIFEPTHIPVHTKTRDNNGR